MENQLQEIVTSSGLEQPKAQFILEKFQGYFAIAAEWETKAKAIVVTDDEQKSDMQIARVGRLFLREKRVAIEKARKELKEQALREGKAIDGIANVLKALIEPIEEYLDKQEHFTEYRLQAEADAKAREQAAQEEANRIAKEKAEAEERVRLAAENAELKRKADEDRAKNEAERKKNQEALDRAEQAKKAAEAETAKAKEKVAEVKKEVKVLKREMNRVVCPNCNNVFQIEKE
jgi:hypothetical protein